MELTTPQRANVVNQILVILKEPSIPCKLFFICLIFKVFGPYSSSLKDNTRTDRKGRKQSDRFFTKRQSLQDLLLLKGKV